MADSYSPNSEPTTRTLLRRVLDTADSRSPRRRSSVRAGTQRTLPKTPLSWRLRSQTKPTTKRRSHGTKSVGRPVHSQARRHLEEQTPRTLFQNILRTAPESSILKPESTGKPVPAPTAAQPSRRESSRGSLELQLPELEPSTSPAPALLAPGRRKQRVRLSMFERQVDQGQPVAQEPQETADASSLTSSLNLTFATPLQPQSVKRPGLARKPPPRRAVDVGLLLQDLQDASFAPTGNSLRTSVTTVPTDIVLEDTQPFSQPLAGHSPGVPHFLPHPSHNENEDAERTTSHRTQSSRLGLQSDELQPWPAATPEVTEAVGSQDAAEAEELGVSSGEEDPSNSAAGPEMASSSPRSLQAEQPPRFAEPPRPPDATLPSQAVPARPPPRLRAAGHRPHPDPYKTGLKHYIKLFNFYAKMPMEKAALGMVEKCLDKYFQHLCDDLEVFAAHAGRKTVKPEDLELLMRRQGLVTDRVSLHVLVERHLPLEYRQLLIPCAFSGNSVFPAQ